MKCQVSVWTVWNACVSRSTREISELRIKKLFFSYCLSFTYEHESNKENSNSLELCDIGRDDWMCAANAEPLASSGNLPAAFFLCLCRQLTDVQSSVRYPHITRLTFHTGNYVRYPLWLPRSLDGSDRRRQHHSAEDYVQSLLWWVQSHPMEWGKP